WGSCLGAPAALGRGRRARGLLLFLRSGPARNPPNHPTSCERSEAASWAKGKCARGPKVPPACRRLPRRCVDRRRAVAPALRQAVVEPALLEHGIGEPDPAAHHDDEEKQQERVGDAAVARGLHVFVLPGLLGVHHAPTVAAEGAPGKGCSCPGAAQRARAATAAPRGQSAAALPPPWFPSPP